MPVADAFSAEQAVVAEQSRFAESRPWLDALPGIVAELEAMWELETGSPFRSSVSWVAPARTADGGDVVLKVNLPHREARHEATGLALWDGRGAARLLRADEERWALLVERCRPGVAVHEAGLDVDGTLAAAAGVARALWDVPVPDGAPFETVADVCAEWAGVVRERMERYRPPVDPGLIEHGARLLEELPNTARRRSLVHGDLNPGNIVSSARGWLAIDAKPMVGDPGYDPVPLLGQVDDPFLAPDAPPVVAARYERLAELVDEPVERLYAWGVARQVEACLWYVDIGEAANAVETAAGARLLADLAGH